MVECHSLDAVAERSEGGIKMAELKPCPKCGGRILTYGMPIKVTTPKVLRPMMRVLGIMCVCCGHWKISIRAWNRRAEDGKA